MTSLPRLPPIHETCVSTTKSTQPSQVDTYHIGIADSGATIHFFREKTYFLTYTPVHGKFIMMAKGASSPVLGVGKVSLTINGIPVKLINCYRTPGLRASLHSLHRHRRTHGCSFLGDHNGMYLTFGQFFTSCKMRLIVVSNSTRFHTTQVPSTPWTILSVCYILLSLYHQSCLRPVIRRHRSRHGPSSVRPPTMFLRPSPHRLPTLVNLSNHQHFHPVNASNP
jgi:hypothetical protein